MTKVELVRIQNLILQFLGTQREFVREEKLRDVCKAAEFAVTGEPHEYALHRLLLVVSDILRTFVSERLQMTNVSWRSRSNRPT